ncbi:hypothetical protein AVDCRST_MAG84-2202, partial [uncultured Microcoleus sp.]
MPCLANAQCPITNYQDYESFKPQIAGIL